MNLNEITGIEDSEDDAQKQPTTLQHDLINLILGYRINNKFIASCLERVNVRSLLDLSDDKARELILDVKNYNATVGKEGFPALIFD